MSLTRIGSLLGIITASIVLVGWTLDIEVLKRIYPGFVAMNPMSAVCFILIGLSLLLFEKKTSTGKMLCKVLSIVVFLIGFLKVLEIVTGFVFGIDALLFTSELSEIENPTPNRMAPNTAANFALMGLALFFIDKKIGRFWISQLFITLSLLFSITAIFGYIFNLVQLYAVPSFVPMALHTALLFIVFSLSLLFLLPFEELFILPTFMARFQDLSISKKFVIGFGTIVVILGLTVSYLYALMSEYHRSNEAEQRVANVVENALLLDNVSLGTAVSLQEYRVDRETKHLQEIQSANNNSVRISNEIKKKTQIPAVVKLLNDYDALRPEKANITDRIVEATDSGASSSAILSLDEEREAMDTESRGILLEIISIERTQQEAVHKRLSESSFQMNSIFLVLVLSVLGLIGGISLLIVRSVSGPTKKLTDMAEQIQKGNFDVKIDIHSKDELGELARTLSLMIQKIKESDIALREKNQTLESSFKEVETSKVAVLNILEDLSDEKKKLELAKAKDEAILESIGDGMVVVDQSGKIIILNKAAEQLFQLETHEVVGKEFVEIVKMEDGNGEALPAEKRPMYISLKEKKKVIASVLDSGYRYVRKDGTSFPTAVTVTPVFSEGEVIGGVAVFRDITCEKDVDRMKSEFISLASHQLRTPLSAIRWYSEMLLDGDAGTLSEQQHEFLQNIDESNKRMIALVNSLLNISRIESGRIMVDPVQTNVGELIEGVLKEVGVRSNQKQQTIIKSIHPLENIMTDPRLLRNVIMNLLTNSIKYTPEKGEISIFVSHKDDVMIIQISDNGYGIPKADQAKLFQKFFRASNIVKVEPDGNGLGMYLVKEIVETLKGSIRFESEEGKGSTFWISLPIKGIEGKKGEVTIDS